MNKVSIPSQAFLTAYKRVKFCISKASDRYTLNCVLIDCADTIKMVATDGIKMAVADLPGEATAPGKLMLSAKILPELVDLAKGCETLTIEWDDKNLIFNSAFSFSFETGYPNWRQIVDYNVPTQSVTLNTKTFKAGVKAMAGSVVIDKQHPKASQSMKLTVAGGQATLCPNPLQKWQSAIGMPVSVAAGPEIISELNPNYLYPIIAECPDKDFTLGFGTDGNSPVSHKSGGVRYVLMPMKMGEEWYEIPQPSRAKPSVLRPYVPAAPAEVAA
jgi:DNA polymerase III sliding clamp (beta) subunit (PCNA family)